jgi:hypothetical protein
MNELLYSPKIKPEHLARKAIVYLRQSSEKQVRQNLALRANIDETILLVIITEQGENRNQCEEQRNLFGFPHGFTRRGM